MIPEDNKDTKEDERITPKNDSQETIQSLNLILFGPPGTGKTYKTKSIAVEIIKDSSISKDKGVKEYDSIPLVKVVPSDSKQIEVEFKLFSRKHAGNYIYIPKKLSSFFPQYPEKFRIKMDDGKSYDASLDKYSHLSANLGPWFKTHSELNANAKPSTFFYKIKQIEPIGQTKNYKITVIKKETK